MPVAQCTCGARYKVPAGAEGRKARCKKCGKVFRIPARRDGTIPLADEPDQEGLDAGALPAETASGSMFDQAGVSTAYDPDARGGVSHLPRIRPRTGFWSDVGWTLAFFVSPHNLVMFVVVWGFYLLQWFFTSVPLVGWIMVLLAELYIVAWYMSIIGETAAGEDDLPRFGAAESILDDIVLPALAYYGTFIVLMAPAFAYAMFVAKTVQGTGILKLPNLDLYTLINSAGAAAVPLIVLVALGIFLWPIALMCVSMGGLFSLFRIDLILMAVAKTLPAYIAICLMVAAATVLPGFIVEAATSIATPSGGLGRGGLMFDLPAYAIEIYFSVVTMRLLGLYYLHFKERFPWDWE